MWTFIGEVTEVLTVYLLGAKYFPWIISLGLLTKPPCEVVSYDHPHYIGEDTEAESSWLTCQWLALEMRLHTQTVWLLSLCF